MLTVNLSTGRRTGGDWENTWHSGLQSHFPIGSRSIPYFHVFFLIAILEEAFIRNRIIIVFINYIIIIHINNNSEIKIIMEESKTLFCSSKFPWARERIYSKFIHNLGTRPQKRFASRCLNASDGPFRCLSRIMTHTHCTPKPAVASHFTEWSILGPVGLSAPILLGLSSRYLYKPSLGLTRRPKCQTRRSLA